jgi:predicted nucleic acid-binding protein
LTRFVLDASVALAWVLDNPVPAYASRVEKTLLGGQRGIVPALWHLEVANGLAMAERRRDLGSADIEHALVLLRAAASRAIDTETNLIAIEEALKTARAYRLTAYDAVYLNLARDQNLPLATLDQALREGANKAGVKLLQ